MNKTKVIATVGPSSNDKETIKSLILNGVDCIRINSSYASYSFCNEIKSIVDELNKELKTYVSIMLELKGDKIRIGKVLNDVAFLKYEDKIRVYTSKVMGDNTKFSIEYPNLVNIVSLGSILKIDDGNVLLKVLDIENDYLLCKVIKDGIIATNKSVSLSGIKKESPYLKEADKEIIKYASDSNIDFLSLPSVRTEEDILEVNDLLINLGNDHIQIISKIENIDAVNSIDSIIKVSDGIIISRNALGCEVQIEKIPGIQKSIIKKCNEKGIISIVSSDLFVNMTSTYSPTKSEISDIASSVLDGVSAIMLGSETAISKYPIDSLKILERTIKYALEDRDNKIILNNSDNDTTSNLLYSVAVCADNLKCKAIFAPTITGFTARKISACKPNCPILAISPEIDTVKSLSLNFGVYPVLISELKSFDAIIEVSRKIALDYLKLKKGDIIIITGGYPFKKTRHTNFIKIEEL